MANQFRVPKELTEVYQNISEITDKFCREHLTEEYAVLCRKLTSAVCRKKPSPLLRGDTTLWAATIINVISYINLLSHPRQIPKLNLQTICESLGQKERTVEDKARKLRKFLNVDVLEEDYIAENNRDEAKNPATARARSERTMQAFVNTLRSMVRKSKYKI